MAIDELKSGLRSRVFWVLLLTFAVCGFSTNGLIATHFIPAGHDHGLPTQTAANLLAVIGVFDIVGTLLSGWLTDKVDPRKLLFLYYSLRGVSLIFLPQLLDDSVQPPLFFFIVFYGLDWVATVPPTVALCREHFGAARAGVVFGWVFAGHMIGAGAAASFAGWVRESQGDYFWAWVTSGFVCFLAAAAMVLIPNRRTAEIGRPGRRGRHRYVVDLATAAEFATLAQLTGRFLLRQPGVPRAAKQRTR